MGAASQELTERAKLLISERRYQEAVRACRRALLSQPDHVEVRLLLGEALLAMQRYDEVRVEMVALSRREPLRADVHRLLGEAFLRAQRPDQAVVSLRRALQLDPNDEVAAELLAEAAEEKAPVSTTIERWFADEAEPTIESDSPEWAEEFTAPLPKDRPATSPSATPGPAKIEIDPRLLAPRAPAPEVLRAVELARAAHTEPVRPPGARAPDPSRPGIRAPAPIAPSPARPVGSPVFAEPPPEPQRPGAPAPFAPAPRGAPTPGWPAPSARPVEREPGTDPARPAPRVRSRHATSLGVGLEAPTPSPRPATAAERPRLGGQPAPLQGEATNAARPSAIREAEDPTTSELDVLTPHSAEEPSFDEISLDLPGAPTRARPPDPRADLAPPRRFPGPAAPRFAPPPNESFEELEDLEEDPPTGAFQSPFDADLADPTRARSIRPDEPEEPMTLAMNRNDPALAGLQRYEPQPYAQQPYAQQPYAPDPYAPHGRPPHAPQSHAPQSHAPQARAPQPHAPQPHAPQPHAPQPHAPQPHAPQPRFEPRPPQPAPRFSAIAESDPLLVAAPRREAPRADKQAGTDRVAREAASRTARTGRRSLLGPVLGGLGALLAVGLVGGLVLYLVLGANEVAEVRERAAQAGDSGSREALQAVVAEIGDAEEAELRALKARLLATLTLEHDLDHGDEVRALLAGLDPLPTDGSIATALLSIEAGQPEEATRTISGLPAEGESIAEGYRTSALANSAMGRWDRAAETARQAFEVRRTSPRHLALHALAQHRLGHSAEAITLLEGHPDHATNADLRVNLARILQESTRDPARAAVEASAVIDELSARASAPQLAWAHLCRATRRIDQGDTAGALVDARAAAEHPPGWDPLFGVQLVEAFLGAGAPAEADRNLATLRPPDEQVEAQRARAFLTARVALAVGDHARATSALDNAGSGPRQSLLRARILEGQGRGDEARPLYESAMNDPGPEGRRARVQLASMAMRQNVADRAIELLEPVYPAATDDLELVPVLARAYLAEGRATDTARVLEVALRARPGAPELLATRGALELYRGQVTEALASLRQAAEVRPDDAMLHVDLGEAARRAGELEPAQAAFERALTLSPGDPRALLGLARLAIGRSAFDEAVRHLDAAATTRQEEREIARLRGEIFVARGDGALGLELLGPLARRFDDASLWISLGELQAQAELDRDAARSFDEALRTDRGNPDALLGRSLIQMRRGSIGGAASSIEEAEAAAATRGTAEALAPRIAVARARIDFEQARFDRAVQLANTALAREARLASAHLLLANVAIEQGRPPVDSLRAAVTGHAPPPEAVGRLAARLGRGEEGCRLAARYLAVAPRGYDATDVRQLEEECPQQ